MAAGIMQLLHGNRLYIASCGVRLGQDLDGFVLEVMDEIGVDLSTHKSKTFDQLEDGFFDTIITLSPQAHHKAIDMTPYMDCEVEYWKTLDPSLFDGSRDQRLDMYRQVRDELMNTIKTRFPRTAFGAL